MHSNHQALFRCRAVLGLFILALLVSGITAFPLARELDVLADMRGIANASVSTVKGFDAWLLIVRDGLHETYARYPWIGYGTDWLAFSHIVVAIFFVGPLINPARNIWVLQAGLIACALIIPMALIGGALRGIPLGWRFIDCAFGVVGAIPLLYCLAMAKRLAADNSHD